MKVVGFAGYSGSGKTTLIERLIPALKARGLRVSVVKHAHHKFDIDHPGKDSYRHRVAGAFEVVVASDQRLALVREYEQLAEPTVHALIAELRRDVDWVMVEGFKHSDVPKIEVWRGAHGKPSLFAHDPRVLAVATDFPHALPATTACRVLDLNRPEDVAHWLLEHQSLFAYLRKTIE